MGRQITTPRASRPPSPLRTPPMSGTTASTLDGEMKGPPAPEQHEDVMRASAEVSALDCVAAEASEAASAPAAAEALPRQVPEEVADGGRDGVGAGSEQQPHLVVDVDVSRTVDDDNNQAGVATAALPLLVTAPVEDAVVGGAVGAAAEKTSDEQVGLMRTVAEESALACVPEHAVSAQAGVELLPQDQVPQLTEDAVVGALGTDALKMTDEEDSIVRVVAEESALKRAPEHAASNPAAAEALPLQQVPQLVAEDADSDERAQAEQHAHGVEDGVSAIAEDSAADEGAQERLAEQAAALAAATAKAAAPYVPEDAADAEDAKAHSGSADAQEEKDDVEGVISVTKDSVLERPAAEHAALPPAAAGPLPQEQVAEQLFEAPRPEAQSNAGQKPIDSTRGRLSSKVAKVLYNEFFVTSSAKELLVNLEKVTKEAQLTSFKDSKVSIRLRNVTELLPQWTLAREVMGLHVCERLMYGVLLKMDDLSACPEKAEEMQQFPILVASPGVQRDKRDRSTRGLVDGPSFFKRGEVVRSLVDDRLGIFVCGLKVSLPFKKEGNEDVDYMQYVPSQHAVLALHDVAPQVIFWRPEPGEEGELYRCDPSGLTTATDGRIPSHLKKECMDAWLKAQYQVMLRVYIAFGYLEVEGEEGIIVSKIPFADLDRLPHANVQRPSSPSSSNMVMRRRPNTDERIVISVGDGPDESDTGSAAGEKEEKMMEETVMEDVEEAFSDTMSIANKRLWQTHCCNAAKRYKPLVKAFQDYIKMAPSMDENLARHKLKTLMEKYNDFKKFAGLWGSGRDEEGNVSKAGAKQMGELESIIEDALCARDIINTRKERPMPSKKASTRAPAGKADNSDDERLTESILSQSHKQLAIAQKKQDDLMNQIEEMNRLNKKAAAEIEKKEKILLQTGASKEAAVVELALMRQNLEKAQEQEATLKKEVEVQNQKLQDEIYKGKLAEELKKELEAEKSKNLNMLIENAEMKAEQKMREKLEKMQEEFMATRTSMAKLEAKEEVRKELKETIKDQKEQELSLIATVTSALKPAEPPTSTALVSLKKRKKRKHQTRSSSTSSSSDDNSSEDSKDKKKKKKKEKKKREQRAAPPNMFGTPNFAGQGNNIMENMMAQMMQGHFMGNMPMPMGNMNMPMGNMPMHMGSMNMHMGNMPTWQAPPQRPMLQAPAYGQMQPYTPPPPFMPNQGAFPRSQGAPLPPGGPPSAPQASQPNVHEFMRMQQYQQQMVQNMMQSMMQNQQEKPGEPPDHLG